MMAIIFLTRIYAELKSLELMPKGFEMMTPHEFAITYLHNVEERYKAYFDSVGVSIMDCVKIQDPYTPTVTITYDGLRPEIKHQIEMMFWDGK